MRPNVNEPLPKSVGWLGYGGLVPFVGLALLTALEPTQRALWQQGLLAYGAVILSFVGALHWAFAMLLPGLNPGQRQGTYAWSVLPALVAWPSLLLPGSMGMWLLVAGFIAHYLQDRRLAAFTPLPDWYLPLRWRLTTVACLSMVVALLAAAVLR